MGGYGIGVNSGSGGGGSSPTSIAVLSTDFTGNVYQNDLLIGLTADTQFLVYGDTGAGTLYKVGDTYNFNSTTGEITMPAEDIRIVIL